MSRIKKVVAGAAITASLGLGFWASKAFYTVKEVIDGDTFITTEDQYVRFNSINAPEIDYCLGRESKAELEKLVLHKKVFLKVTYINGMRLTASVYTAYGNVGEKMLAKGLAVLENNSLENQPSMKKASDKAREKKIGVYSDKCTQATNPQNIKCNIKGNTTAKVNYYRFPKCKYYGTTIVQLHLGDQWFCTEAEANKAGFTKGTDCP